MKFFKKALLALAFGLVSMAPVKAEQANFLSTCLSTSATAVQCGEDGLNLLYGVIATGVSSTTYVVLRDTGTPNVTSSTKAVVYADNGRTNGSQEATIVYEFPNPILFVNGISVNNSGAASGSTDQFYILYKSMGR